ncbi:hypothetical protein ACVWWG_006204 [Bradyrhizobium sp. LB7.2]
MLLARGFVQLRLMVWGAPASLSLQRNSDDVVADREPIAVAQAVRPAYALVGTIEKGAVGRDVVQPIATVAKVHLAMLSGNRPRRIRQRPVEVTVPANIDRTPAGDRKRHRSAVRKIRFVLDIKAQHHHIVSLARRARFAACQLNTILQA